MSCFSAVLTVLLIGLAASGSHAADATLARLSFWLPPERMSEFEVAYKEKVLPIVERYGFRESVELGRPALEGSEVGGDGRRA